MTTVNVTYHAPEGDSPVVETRGVRFFDGQALPLDAEEHAELISKARNNPHFEVEGEAGEDKPLTGLAKARAAKAAKRQQQNL